MERYSKTDCTRERTSKIDCDWHIGCHQERMEHLAIVERLCESHWDILHDPSSPDYIFSAAIYDTWSVGTDLEKNLAARLVQSWADELEGTMIEDYKDTRHSPGRPERDVYYAHWIKGHRAQFADHKGLLAALDLVKIPA